MDKKTYLVKLYSYLAEKQYAVLRDGSGWMESLKAVPLSDTNYFNEKGGVTSYSFSKFHSEKSFEEYISKSKKTIQFPPNDLTLVNFFIEIFNNSSKEDQIILLKNIEEYTDYLWRKDCTRIFQSISNNKKELLDNILTVPVSIWESKTIKISEIDALLKSKGIEDNESFNFYLKFFKTRKNQIKHAEIGPKVRDFLLSKYGYNEEKLKPYFDFFNYIKELFQEIDLDFNEPSPKYTITSRINCRKAAKLLCIDGHNEDGIKSLIEEFISGMKSYKKLDQAHVDVIDKPKAIIEIRCYTNTPFTQEELNSDIKQYLLFKKKNLNIPTNKEYVEKWLMKRDLDAQLSSDPKQTSKKIKI